MNNGLHSGYGYNLCLKSKTLTCWLLPRCHKIVLKKSLNCSVTKTYREFNKVEWNKNANFAEHKKKRRRKRYKVFFDFTNTSCKIYRPHAQNPCKHSKSWFEYLGRCLGRESNLNQQDLTRKVAYTTMVVRV